METERELPIVDLGDVLSETKSPTGMSFDGQEDAQPEAD